MSKRNKFLEGVFLGAFIGGVYSLLDKETKDTIFKKGKETAKKTVEVIRNPAIVIDNVTSSIREVKTTFQQISEDITFVTDKIHELKETTPQMIEIVKDTKDILTKDNNNSIT